jgi:hypothetical protein
MKFYLLVLDDLPVLDVVGHTEEEVRIAATKKYGVGNYTWYESENRVKIVRGTMNILA